MLFFIDNPSPKILCRACVNAPFGDDNILKNVIVINAGTAQGSRYIVLNNVLPFILSLLRTIARINPKAIANVVATKVQIICPSKNLPEY